MAYRLSDIFIGEFPKTQDFGADPQRYSALYNLRGHNGIDLSCPTMTPIVSAADGWVSEIGSKQLGTFDAGGYGNYIKVVHNGYLTLYAHLNDIAVNLKDRVVAGQLLGHSDNSGFSTGPHLHFGVAPCDANGNKTQKDNGYSGYINPNGPECEWHIQNLKEPVRPDAEVKPPVPVPFNEFPIIVGQGTNYKVVVSYLIEHGLNAFLSNNGQEQIDLEKNPGDPKGGEKAVMFLADLFHRLDLPIPQAPTVIEEQTAQLSQEEKANYFTKLISAFLGFYTKK